MELFDFDETGHVVQTANYTMHYHEAGEGPVFILLHGSGPGVSGWSNFKGNFPVFAKDFRTLIVDMPGFGMSSMPKFTKAYPEHAADAVVELMDALGIEQAHFLGNSMGGFVATELAVAHPDRVSRLVMMGPGGLFVPVTSPDRSEGSKALQGFMADPTRENMVGWIDTMVSNTDIVSDELVDERLANALKPGVLEATIEIFGSLGRFPATCRSLRSPTRSSTRR